MAWDQDVVYAFVDKFPEAEKALRVFALGSNVSPMLNRAAARAKDMGYLEPGVVGNKDARSYNQRTWCRTWRITPAGRRYVEEKAQ